MFTGCSDEQTAVISDIAEEYGQRNTDNYIPGDDANLSIKNLAGYVSIYGNMLYLEEVRVIIYDFLYPHHSFVHHAGENIVVVAQGDGERLNEFGVEESEDWLEIWPNGFSIEPLERGTISFELTNDTTFTFVDTGFLFLDDSYMDRTYHTRIIDEFLLHRGESNTVLFVQIENGRVVNITEELLLTQ
jgi:hypothetical protein